MASVSANTMKKTTTPILEKRKQDEGRKTRGLYMLSIITRKTSLPFTSVGSNIRELLEKKLRNDLEGKCSVEGYIKPGSIRIQTYSSGILRASNVVFDVVIECLVCSPVEGMKFNVNVVNITKAGLRCDVGENSPIDVFVARDHHYNNTKFQNISVGNRITVSVIGQRYEINDERISVIAEIV